MTPKKARSANQSNALRACTNATVAYIAATNACTSSPSMTPSLLTSAHNVRGPSRPTRPSTARRRNRGRLAARHRRNQGNNRQMTRHIFASDALHPQTRPMRDYSSSASSSTSRTSIRASLSASIPLVAAFPGPGLLALSSELSYAPVMMNRAPSGRSSGCFSA